MLILSIRYRKYNDNDNFILVCVCMCKCVLHVACVRLLMHVDRMVEKEKQQHLNVMVRSALLCC